MQFNRKELIKLLEICKPALDTQNRAVELGHYWCDGNNLSAYNGRMIISVPFDIDLVGGIPHTVLDWLKKTDSSNITLNHSDGKVRISAGRSRMDFVLLDDSRRIYTSEIHLDELDAAPIPVDAEMVDAFEHVLVSRDKQATAPAKLGVFLHPYNGCIELYATDDYSVSKACIAERNEIADSLVFTSHIVIPFPFVDQIIEHKDNGTLYITDTIVVLYAEPVTVISSLVECSNMPDFEGMINSFEAPLVTIPEGIEEGLERLYAIDGPINMTITDGVMHLTSEQAGSSAEEQFQLAEHNTGGIMVKLDPKLVKRVIKKCSRLGIKSRGLYLTGSGDFTHIMAALK